MSPSELVATDLATRVVRSTDNSIYQLLPDAVATPRTAADVSDIVTANHRSSAPRPIVARGGGTGTNGQSLTTGLVIDTKRHLDGIITIDPAERLAVVEPGVVTAALNTQLAPHGLFWAPHTSTMNRATVGGMISTDAAGKGSLVHGRTHRHVAALDLCLADGTITHLAPTALAAAEERAIGSDSAARLWRTLLDLPIDASATGGPTLARGWTGYGVERFRTDDIIDPAQLVIGAEGTLGIVTRAWLRLTELPTRTVAIVASFGSFNDALHASLDLASTGPTAIETFDETTLEAARSSPAWPALGDTVGPDRGAVLVLEYAAHRHQNPDPSTSDADRLDADRLDTVRRSHGCRAARLVIDDDERAAVWKVRSDAVGLLARHVVRDETAQGTPRSARPTAMVEDCAVPVDAMADFIAGFRDLLDGAGLEYGMFGHADVGCVHVRPALDLTDPDHERLVGELTDRVIDLVDAHGGVLWGEHGRGFRGEAVERFISPEAHDLMRRVKTAFDPDDRCNPGKLYRPLGNDAPLVGVTEAPLRGQADRLIPVSVRTDHASAFACNGNGLCHDVESAAPMCPSYQASGDPAESPKGRSDLLRAWLSATEGTASPDSMTVVAPEELARFEDDLAANLHRCLSCAACSGRCPVEVDIPELKSRFLEQHHATRRRPVADLVMSRFEQLAPWIARLPAGGAFAVRPIERLLGLADLPTPSRSDPLPFPRFDQRVPMDSGIERVVIVPDVFTSVLEPRTLAAAARSIATTGVSLTIAPFIPSGKFDHVKGRRAAFARSADRQRDLIRSIVDAGATAVQIEPAVTLMHHHEYRHASVARTGATGRGAADGAVVGLATWFDDHRSSLRATPSPTHVTLLGHCTERARHPDEITRWQRVLEAVGHQVEIVDVGCCGMAGVFGHERPNQQMSQALWNLNWAGPIRAASGVVAATGWSCRSQAERFGSTEVIHPVRLL